MSLTAADNEGLTYPADEDWLIVHKRVNKRTVSSMSFNPDLKVSRVVACCRERWGMGEWAAVGALEALWVCAT